MTSIPASVEEAQSASWLSSVLGAEVTQVEGGPVDQRISTNIPVHVELADGHACDLWIKGYFGEIGEMARYAGVPEVMFYRDVRGTVGMALDWRDTAGSQWFITLSPQPHLDARYTAFARVVNGWDVLDRLSQWDVIDRVRIWDGVTFN